MIVIPAGLLIGKREIDIEIEYDPKCNAFEFNEVGGSQVGIACITPTIRDALEAAAAYQKEIGNDGPPEGT